LTAQHMPRLCIGLPVYNGDNYLAQTIESLLGQTFTDFRLLISDNASTAATAARTSALAAWAHSARRRDHTARVP